MALIGRTEEITVRAIISRMINYFIEVGKKIYRVTRHLDIHVRRKLSAHATHALACGTLALVAFALEHDDVAAAGLGELVGDAGADDSAPDDHDFGGRIHITQGII